MAGAPNNKVGQCNYFLWASDSSNTKFKHVSLESLTFKTYSTETYMSVQKLASNCNTDFKGFNPTIIILFCLLFLDSVSKLFTNVRFISVYFCFC